MNWIELNTYLTIDSVFILFTLSFLVACFEAAIQIYLEKGMVLEFWFHFLKWLTKIRLTALAYIFGLCPYCNGFWLSVGAYYLYFHHLSLTTLLFTGLNAVIIRIFVIIKIIP